MTDYYFYPYVALTGGDDGALDSLDGSLLKDGDGALVIDPATQEYYAYTLDADSGLAESSPDVIAPDANAGDKRWIRVTADIDDKIDLVTGKDNLVPYFTSTGNLAASTVNYTNLQNATKIQSKSVNSTAPTDGQILRFNNTTPAWEPTSIGSWKYSGANIYNNTTNPGWPTTWTALDLSSIVGASRALVQLEVVNGASTVEFWGCRMKGSSLEIGRDQDASRGAGMSAGSMLANKCLNLMVTTAANGVIEIKSSNNSANSNINVQAYVRLG